jgi:hypothetical protein
MHKTYKFLIVPAVTDLDVGLGQLFGVEPWKETLDVGLNLNIDEFATIV